MRILCVILIAISIAGCTRTVYVDRPVEVKVGVPIPCLEVGDVPPPMIYPVDWLKPGATAGEIIRDLLAERTLRGKMEDALRGVLGKCAGSGST